VRATTWYERTAGLTKGEIMTDYSALRRVTQWLREQRAQVLLLLAAVGVFAAIWANPSGSANAFGDFLAAIGAGTSFALVLSIVQHLQHLYERERVQALLVSCWVGIEQSSIERERHPCLYVMNNSQRPIWNVSIESDRAVADPAPTGWAMIPPGKTLEASLPCAGDASGLRPSVRFTDDSGVTWHRDGFALTVASRTRGAVPFATMDFGC
jgi:hypothetical protein